MRRQSRCCGACCRFYQPQPGAQGLSAVPSSLERTSAGHVSTRTHSDPGNRTHPLRIPVRVALRGARTAVAAAACARGMGLPPARRCTARRQRVRAPAKLSWKGGRARCRRSGRPAASARGCITSRRTRASWKPERPSRRFEQPDGSVGRDRVRLVARFYHDERPSVTSGSGSGRRSRRWTGRGRRRGGPRPRRRPGPSGCCRRSR